MSVRVAIVEDEPSVRNNLARLLESTRGFACACQCADAEEAIRVFPRERPDVALIDIHLPEKSGIDCVRELKPILPSTQFLMLTIEEDSARVFESLKAGASGYLVKNVAPEKILDAVADIHRGGSPISSHIARLIVRAFHEPVVKERSETNLTPRESEILGLLSRGYRSKEIADELAISVPTVNTHVRNIYDKLHVRSRAEAVAQFLQGQRSP